MSFHFIRTPHPEETLYSVAARMRAAIGFSSALEFVRRFYSACKLSLGLGLTSFLPEISHDATRHQPLHFITSFIVPPVRRHAVWNAIERRDTMQAGYLLGRAGSRRLVGEFMRYCPRCAQEQREVVGEAYWMRGAQIVGVSCCALHGQKLVVTKITRRQPGELHQLDSVLERDGLIGSEMESNVALVAIAKNVAKLMDFEPTWDGGRLDQGWRRVLQSHGMSAYGRGVVKRIQRGLADLYGDQYLLESGCAISINPEHSWVARFLRAPAKEHDPLRHLLMLGILEESLERLIEEAQFFAFGNPRLDIATLTCSNATCPEYGKRSIKQTRIFRDPHSRAEIGHYTCGYCDTTFARSMSDSAPGNDRVVDRGDHWRKSLTRDWGDNSLSLRELSRRLHADPMTIKREAVKLGLSFPRPSSRPTRKAPPAKAPLVITDADRDRRRAAWLAAIARKKFVKPARELRPAIYAWLYRHDRDWLADNCPARAQVVNVSRIDWEERQQVFLDRVPSAYWRITGARPFRRCSLSAIAREIGAGRLSSHLERMPKLHAQINELIENKGLFAVRRIAAVADEYRNVGISFTRLRTLAGIPNTTASIPAVRNFMLEQLEKKVRT